MVGEQSVSEDGRLSASLSVGLAATADRGAGWRGPNTTAAETTPFFMDLRHDPCAPLGKAGAECVFCSCIDR